MALTVFAPIPPVRNRCKPDSSRQIPVANLAPIPRACRPAWSAASETVPKFISKSDPAAQWTGAHKSHAFFAYANNYLIDLKAAIIVDVEATRAIRQAEVGATRTMIERTEERLELCPERISADSAYGSAEWCNSAAQHLITY
jgi:hypothetical protein